MAARAVDPVFVDSNGLINAAGTAAPSHGAAVPAAADLRQAQVPLRISRRILREYLAILSRPRTSTAAADVTHFLPQIHGLGRLPTHSAADFARLARPITALSL